MFRARDVGEELLREAFPDVSADRRITEVPQSTPEWVPFGEAKRRPESPYKNTPIREIERDLEELNGGDEGRRAQDDVRHSPRDVLAWYAPYSFHGPGRWGIYYNDPLIDFVVARTALEMLPAAPDTPLNHVGQMVRSVVRAHEVFHFAVESAAAVMTIDTGMDCYRTSFAQSLRHDLEEALATAVEIGAPHRWRNGPYRPEKSHRREFARVWESIGRPHPYSGWGGVASNLPVALDDLTSMLSGRRLGQVVAAMYELAPTRDTHSRLPEFHRDLRSGSAMAFSTLRRPSLALVRKHARNAIRNGRPPGAAWEPSSGGDHPVKLKAPNKSTVPIPVKDDRIGDHVVSQLAEFFGVSKSEYLEELRALS